MTTPHERLREAADNFREFANTGNDAHVSAEDCEIAANTLRALASAQSDAEKGFDEWWKDYWDEYFNEAGARHIYLAGHAQGYAAGLAAQEAKVKELEARSQNANGTVELLLKWGKSVANASEIEALKLWRLDELRIIEEAYRKFAYSSVDILQLTMQRAKELEAELEQNKRWVTGYEAAEVILRNSCDLAEEERDTVADVLDQVEEELATTKADALELANEVRRCHELAQEGHDAEWDDHCGQCDDVIDNRPASVTAAIERYK